VRISILIAALASTPSPTDLATGRAPVFLCLDEMNDLVAKAAIDRRIAEIISPVIEDMGFEIVRHVADYGAEAGWHD